jgi:hypothetical protein
MFRFAVTLRVPARSLPTGLAVQVWPLTLSWAAAVGQHAYRGDDFLTECGKCVSSVPISGVEHGIAEVAFDQDDLVTERGSVGSEVRCGGLKGRESSDLGEALQTFPSPLPCQCGLEDGWDVLVVVERICGVAAKSAHRDVVQLGVLRHGRCADTAFTRQFGQRPSLDDVFSVKPVPVEGVLPRRLGSAQGYAVVAGEFGDGRLADADRGRDVAQAALLVFVELDEE